MQRIRGLWQGIRRVRPRTWLLGFGGAVVLLLLFAAGLYAWDYTNSSYFCGTTCHTMPPHYDSYLRSPHARVECVECHIGRTSFGIKFTRKANDAQFVWSYVTQQYEYPLYAKGLQPARESCEKCHWPEKFSWDKVVTKKEYQTDPANTLQETTLVMKIGGGTQREGLGRGIHWHIENPIDFIYTDSENLKQNIPWIQVTNPDGTTTVYTDIENPLTPEQITELPKRRMDCIDCHNRVSHTFLSPSQAMDNLLSTKQIDPTIPNIKEKGIEVLSVPYGSSLELANQAIARVEQYYQQNYPEYYQQNTAAVKNAVQQLQTWYPKLHFPDQGLDWNTHPDNIGHKDWPGCFRCHDGKHFTQDRKQVIRLECNVCHSIPVISTTGGAAPVITLEQATEPDSHKTSTWLLEHRTKFDATCQQCHDTRNAGGSDNTSFCSNSACHGTKWKYAGFDAPAIAQIIKPPVKAPSDPNAPPVQIPHPIGGNPDCQICHGLNSKVRPMPADHEGRTNDLCLACHKPSIPPEGFDAQAGKPPSIPHEIAGRAECLGCHNSGASSFPQVPQSHLDQKFTNGQCTTCHQPSKPGESNVTPAATTTPGAVETPAASPTPSSSAAEATPTPGASSVSGQPPNLPPDHFTAGCTTCHATGANGAPKFPDNHASYTNDLCLTCHKQPTTIGDDNATTTPGAESKSSAIPNIPPDHATNACAACHSTGALGAPKFPDNHADYRDAQCVDCHKQTQ
jgi:nitrate/TMAO reductase-like tetraheme cytochrome c subunit/cytochrome c5